jgi:hypothetical protein
VIRPHLDSIATSFKVIAPVLKALNYSYKFLVRSRIVKLSTLKLLRKESNRVPLLSVFL